MPSVPKVNLLPPAVRAELDAKLAEQAFGDIVATSAWLETKGHAIGKSSLGAYALTLKRRAHMRELLAGAGQPTISLPTLRLQAAAVAASAGATRDDLFERADEILAWALDAPI